MDQVEGLIRIGGKAKNLTWRRSGAEEFAVAMSS
jgi:hypothetical protein